MKIGLNTFRCVVVLSVMMIGQSLLQGQENFVDKMQTFWLESLNQEQIDRSILEYYTSNAAIDYGDGLSQGSVDLYMSLVNFKAEAGKCTLQKVIGRTTDTRDNHMEMGIIRSGSSKQQYVYVTALKNNGGRYEKEFEMILPFQPSGKLPDRDIDEKRMEWQQWSNRHQPTELLNRVYSSDAVYVNNGRISRGRKAIAQRYQYMTGDNWNIELTGIHLQRVDADTVFELGKYVSSGEGRYFLIWKKQSDGKWLASLDFNF